MYIIHVFMLVVCLKVGYGTHISNCSAR